MDGIRCNRVVAAIGQSHVGACPGPTTQAGAQTAQAGRGRPNSHLDCRIAHDLNPGFKQQPDAFRYTVFKQKLMDNPNINGKKIQDYCTLTFPSFLSWYYYQLFHDVSIRKANFFLILIVWECFVWHCLLLTT